MNITPKFEFWYDRVKYYEDLIKKSTFTYTSSACPDIQIYDNVLLILGSGSYYGYIDTEPRDELISNLNNTSDRTDALYLALKKKQY